MSDDDDDRQAAEAALAAGDFDGAYQRLRAHVWYPTAPPLEAARLAELLELLGRAFAGLGHGELAAAAARAAADVADPDALYGLGYELLEVGLPELAATVLGRCLEIFEDFCIVTQSVRAGLDVQVEVVPQA